MSNKDWYDLFRWLILIAGVILPFRWIVRVWAKERIVRTPVAIAALIFHCAMLELLWNRGILLFVYCCLILGAIAMNDHPFTGNIAGRRIDDKDIDNCRRILERDPKNAAAQIELGDIYMRRRRYDQAITEYKKAIELLGKDQSMPIYNKLREATIARRRLWFLPK